MTLLVAPFLLLAAVVASAGGGAAERRRDVRAVPVGFGDGTSYVTTAGNSVSHKYKKWGTYEVRIEVTDSLGHSALQKQTLVLSKR
jgi:hypothetical protein